MIGQNRLEKIGHDWTEYTGQNRLDKIGHDGQNIQDRTDRTR